MGYESFDQKQELNGLTYTQAYKQEATKTLTSDL